MSDIRVLSCASEMTPYAKTGGLADVAGSLPRALKQLGVDVTCVMPLYGAIDRDAHGIHPTGEGFTVRLDVGSVNFSIHRGESDGVPVYFLQADDLFDRNGLYGAHGADFADNCRRFSLFAMGCIQLNDYLGLRPDVVHVHDWQTALIPVYLTRRPAPCPQTLLTIHNLAYQGLFPAEDFHWTGLDWSYFHWQKLEYYGKVNFLKGGMVHADAISTVSPTYAREIQNEESGCGLEGVLVEKHDRLHGILNGIDTAHWNPESDPLIPARFSARDIRGKEACRAALIDEAEIAPTDRPLTGVVTRLAEQKGLDILVPAMRTLLGEGYPFVVLGTGDPVYEARLEELAAAFPSRLGLFLTFDNGLAHLIEAGSDMFAMPSRFEPCGLNQFYSMRYGTVPVARATGGLADSVTPYSPDGARAGHSTGFTFDTYSAGALTGALRDAIAVFEDRSMWRSLMHNGMTQEFGWQHSAKRYVELYREMIA